MKSAFVSFACLLTGIGACHAGSLVDVRVIDRDSGSTLHTYRHDGRSYIAGTPGHRYAIRLHNRTGARVLTVLSVDGVNAISGENAKPDQTGYVLGPYETTTINGWRKSLSQIAEFNFTALSDSYAARTGRPQNVGVIGVAVFREKSRVYTLNDAIASNQPSASMRDGESARPAARAASPAAGNAEPSQPLADLDSLAKAEESLGTGHGHRVASQATYTNFERATSRPQEIDAIWYDSYRNLASHGIIQPVRPIAAVPQPFPNQFVADPPM